MQTLAAKLTVAILIVGVISALLVGIITSFRIKQAFDEFLLRRARPNAEIALQNYYREHGNWDNIGQGSRRLPNIITDPNNLPLATVADAEGIIIYGGGPNRIGRQAPRRLLDRSVPIYVEGELVGYLIFDLLGNNHLPEAPERLFLATLNRSILLASVAAAALALLLGAFIASTLTRPIRELTAATQQIAEGRLGVQLPIHTQDEVGKLTQAFNSMSADLERSSVQRKQMTADIAHDLRTPLSVILGYTEALSEGKLAADQEIAQTLHREAQHLNHLVDDLRTLSLADAGELPLHLSTTAPISLLESATSSHGRRAEELDIQLVVDAPHDLPDVNVDSQRMAQVLGNLVSNALRHTPPGGSVTLAAREVASGVALTVTDTGSGIKGKDLPYVFDRFYRSDKSRSEDGVSGLGLTIARSIVEAHGGTISATSVPGKGAEFTVVLPVGNVKT